VPPKVAGGCRHHDEPRASARRFPPEEAAAGEEVPAERALDHPVTPPSRPAVAVDQHPMPVSPWTPLFPPRTARA
jgi:hypothetical protein